jgi:hypothetical protein
MSKVENHKNIEYRRQETESKKWRVGVTELGSIGFKPVLQYSITPRY